MADQLSFSSLDVLSIRQLMHGPERNFPSRLDIRAAGDDRPDIETTVVFQRAAREHLEMNGRFLPPPPLPTPTRTPRPTQLRASVHPQPQPRLPEPQEQPDSTPFEQVYDNRHLSRRDEQERIEREQQGVTLSEKFVAGHTLRFSQLKIRRNKERQWNISADSPPNPPTMEKRPPQQSMIRVGMTDDAAPGRRTTDRITGDVTETSHPNEWVFLRLQGGSQGFALCDSFGLAISDKNVIFDKGFESITERVDAALELQDIRKAWDRTAKRNRRQEMYQWREAVRNWEISVLQTEWQRQNYAIFPPETTEQHIQDAVDNLRFQSQQDQRGLIAVEFIARPEPRVIMKERVRKSVAKERRKRYPSTDDSEADNEDSDGGGDSADNQPRRKRKTVKKSAKGKKPTAKPRPRQSRKPKTPRKPQGPKRKQKRATCKPLSKETISARTDDEDEDEEPSDNAGADELNNNGDAAASPSVNDNGEGQDADVEEDVEEPLNDTANESDDSDGGVRTETHGSAEFFDKLTQLATVASGLQEDNPAPATEPNATRPRVPQQPPQRKHGIGPIRKPGRAAARMEMLQKRKGIDSNPRRPPGAATDLINPTLDRPGPSGLQRMLQEQRAAASTETTTTLPQAQGQSVTPVRRQPTMFGDVTAINDADKPQVPELLVLSRMQQPQKGRYIKQRWQLSKEQRERIVDITLPDIPR